MSKTHKTLDIFYRALKGEALSPKMLKAEYNVSDRTITRHINEVKSFLAESRDLIGYAELEYSQNTKTYHLITDNFLSDKEIFAVTEVILASRAFSIEEMEDILAKLKNFAAITNREKFTELIRKEKMHYKPVKHETDSVIDTLWALITYIDSNNEITISYRKGDGTIVDHRLQPVAVLFSDFYFYLIAYSTKRRKSPIYFRIDRIRNIVMHNQTFDKSKLPKFDEAEMRKLSQFMHYGKHRIVKFWHTGLGVQAVLDKLPTAKVVERRKGAYLIEAQTYGEGIIPYLLSQGNKVRVIEPPDLVDEMKVLIADMTNLY